MSGGEDIHPPRESEVRRGKGSGGFIQIRDGRVSAGIAWALGILAVLPKLAKDVG